MVNSIKEPETLEEKCDRLGKLSEALDNENFDLKGRVEDLKCDRDHFKHLSLTLLDVLKHEIEMED